ncbi:MAG: hypothetical protein R3F56_22695 [Planctomycetota bacterium]
MGSTFSPTLSSARANSAGVAFLGLSNPNLDLGVIGAPGCVLRTSTELALNVVTDAGGAATINVAIPGFIGTIGMSFFTQAFVLDPPANRLGLVASDGRVAVIGDFRAPVINTVSSTTLNGGGTVTIRGRNIGTIPGLCPQVKVGNRSARLRPLTLVRDPVTGEDVLTARVPNIEAPLTGQLMLMAGEGQTYTVNATPWMTAPTYAQGWQGRAALGVGPMVTVNAAPGNVQPGAFSQTGGCIEFVIPASPCNGTGEYPIGSQIDLDFHGGYTCAGSTAQRDFDLFGMQVTNPGFPVNCNNIANSLKMQLETILGANFTVTLVGPAPSCTIRICPAAGCTINAGWWGNLRIRCGP